MANEADKPAFDPSAFLAKLEGIAQGQKTSTGTNKSWIGTLIVIVIALVAVAAWAWISMGRNRELAKLRHEKEVRRIQAEKAVVDAKVAVNDAVVVEAEKKAAVVVEQLKHIDADIRAEEERYAADLRAVDRMRSWSDAGIR